MVDTIRKGSLGFNAGWPSAERVKGIEVLMPTQGIKTPFDGMDREWTAKEKEGLNEVLRKYGWR